MILSFWNDLEKVMNTFKDWVIKNSTNWVFWLAIFFAGLIIFSLAINALNKDR